MKNRLNKNTVSMLNLQKLPFALWFHRRISLDLGTAHGSVWGQGLDVCNLLTNGLREKYCMTHTEYK